jgi:hypothetical protein
MIKRIARLLQNEVLDDKISNSPKFVEGQSAQQQAKHAQYLVRNKVLIRTKLIVKLIGQIHQTSYTKNNGDTKSVDRKDQIK